MKSIVEVAPVDHDSFARRAGEIMARAVDCVKNAVRQRGKRR
jgi:hypothetical protein